MCCIHMENTTWLFHCRCAIQSGKHVPTERMTCCHLCHSQSESLSSTELLLLFSKGGIHCNIVTVLLGDKAKCSPCQHTVLHSLNETNHSPRLSYTLASGWCLNYRASCRITLLVGSQTHTDGRLYSNSGGCWAGGISPNC